MLSVNHESWLNVDQSPSFSTSASMMTVAPAGQACANEVKSGFGVKRIQENDQVDIRTGFLNLGTALPHSWLSRLNRMVCRSVARSDESAPGEESCLHLVFRCSPRRSPARACWGEKTKRALARSRASIGGFLPLRADRIPESKRPSKLIRGSFL